jgi:uncharacterized protein (TIGR02594 family)
LTHDFSRTKLLIKILQVNHSTKQRAFCAQLRLRKHRQLGKTSTLSDTGSRSDCTTGVEKKKKRKHDDGDGVGKVMWNTKRSIAITMTCALALGIAAPAYATGAKPADRFANTEPLEPFTRSRSDAIEAAAQVPGAASVLLEALRWRGRSATQIGLPTKLWCADFMNFVLRRAGGKGTQSRAARSFLEYGMKLDGPRVGAIAIMYRQGPNSGHVGVVRGTDGQGNPIIVSGNHGNTVRQSVYSKNRVLAYVMPPQYVLDDMAQAARAAAAQAADTGK